MTIKEMEERSGMVRANIRFYETEGLLNPARASNGYRNYSEYDLELLLRIKLLRTLHMTIEEIKAVQTGEQELTAVLEGHIERLGEESIQIEQSQEICQEMCRDGVHYATLDAPKYLAAIERLEQSAENPLESEQYLQFDGDLSKNGQAEKSGSEKSRSEKSRTEKSQPEYIQDQLPPSFAPWRRYFARTLDMSVYQLLLFLIILQFVSPIYLVNHQGLWLAVLEYVLQLLVMLVVEPLFLYIFKRTPGKWILGLKVTDLHGGRLSYWDALERTWLVFWYGMGGNIPIYSLVRIYKSYEVYLAGETLDWEVNTSLEVQEECNWATRKRFLIYIGRFVGYLATWAALFILLVLYLLGKMMPEYRGELTVEQFSENCNAYLDYFEIMPAYRLNEEGSWIRVWDSGQNVILIEAGPDGMALGNLEFTFIEENGILTGISTEADLGDTGYVPAQYQQTLQMAVHAFVQAQKSASLIGGKGNAIKKQLAERPQENFTLTAYGVTVTYQIGREDLMDGMVDAQYKFRFTMIK